MSTLDSLAKSSTIVCDSGDFNLLKAFKACDATMNPSLLMAAAKNPQYEHLIVDAIKYAKQLPMSTKADFIQNVIDRLTINFGKEILQLVPGVVSTEVDPSLSFDIEKSVKKAKKFIKMYEEVGVPKDRILIKLATTWEGCQAASLLESQNIHCNMTLIFTLCQAIAAADVRATVISPFVGRILDWHKQKNPDGDFSGEKDPGVQKVKEIFNYYKKFGYKTIVMGASFRNVDQILQLSGIDKLTISPKLMQELKNMTVEAPKRLTRESAMASPIEKLTITQPIFRWLLNEDHMASDKLYDGIRLFHKDSLLLKEFIQSYIESH